MNASYIVSGQNVRIRPHLAGIAPRAVALVIDMLVEFFYFYCLFSFMDYTGIEYLINEWVVFFVFILPALLYMPLSEALFNGKTVGKYVMGIRVVRIDGQPLTLGNVLMRFLLLTIDTGVVPGLGAVLIALTPRSQRIGDMAAGTTVVSDRAFRSSRVDLSVYDYLMHDYAPEFARASELTPKQAGIIERVLASKGTDRDMRLFNLMRKVEPVCGACPKEYPNAEAYLVRVLNDWRHYQLTEDL